VSGFRHVLDTVAGLCANATNEKWLGRLPPADVYGLENARFVLESLRIDYAVLGSAWTV
jgi:hypothetical protein